jgi:hypothetical protein
LNSLESKSGLIVSAQHILVSGVESLKNQALYFFSYAYNFTTASSQIGVDIDAGIRHYDVQVKEGSGDWAGWLTGVSDTGATFVGALDYTYTFRIKATDNVSNTPPF